MTAITPLESIHKIGLFGDHHKKNEKDLLKISEVDNLSITQIVKYKKSEINIKTIKIDGLEFPSENSNVTCDQKTRILCTGPNTWLVMSKKEDIAKIIKQECRIEDFALTDISHSRAIIQIAGLQAKEVLKKGCPFNFTEFKKNNSTSSTFHGITFTIDYIDEESKTFNLIVLRSFGESLYHHITDSSLEFGYVGV